MQCTLTIPVTTGADVTAEQVAKLLRYLIDVGLADAADTVVAGEGDCESAQLATDLNIGTPVVLNDAGGPERNIGDRPRKCPECGHEAPGVRDDVPIGTPGRLVAEDGRPVGRTLESVLGSCGIVEAIRKPDGSLKLTFDGYTQVCWDSQETVTHNGQPVFLDEDGSQIHGSAVRLARP